MLDAGDLPATGDIRRAFDPSAGEESIPDIGKEHLPDESTLSASRYSGHTGQPADRKYRIDILEIVKICVCDLDPLIRSAAISVDERMTQGLAKVSAGY